jgi:hypothetical protein
MADVVFALGSRARLSRPEALELAELLARQRTPAAVSANGKIRVQADTDQEASTDIVPGPEELAELLDVLQEPHYPEELASFTHLRAAIAAAIGYRS